MKILVICQYYYPEPFRITDICEELVARGHEVSVITGTPNYPMGKIYPGYEKGQKTDETIGGVKVHRCPTAPRKTGVFHRVLNYFSYAYLSVKYVKRLEEEFDVVFVNQLSPVMMAEAGIVYKKKFGKKLVLYCLDLWPESLTVGNIKKGSLIYRIFHQISKRIYRAADMILASSHLFEKYLSENFDINDEHIDYLPQYAESQFLGVCEKVQTECFNLLFAGNIGAAQGIKTVTEAARLLSERNIFFHIVGDGIEWESMKKEAADLPHMIFYGRKSLVEMNQYYEMADAMLVTLTPEPVLTLTLPGKIQSYMAAGRPIIGAVGGETADMLAKAQGGYYGAEGDAKTLARNILALIESERSTEIGRANREYYLSHFSKEIFFEKLIDKLESSVTGHAEMSREEVLT